MGYLSAPWFHARLSEPVPLFGFQLFFAVAMSITAIPVLGRIFMELGLSHTRTAALTIGAAAIDDVSGWIILGTIVAAREGRVQLGLGRSRGLPAWSCTWRSSSSSSARRFVAPSRTISRATAGCGSTVVPYVVILLFVSAAITSNLGVFAIIGGFVIGVALHDDRRFVEEWKRRVSPIVWVFFLPIFFAYTGLRTDIGAIRGWSGLLTLVLVLAVAFVSKLGGAYAIARLVGEPHRSALTIGVCMNTRGLMELIVLNIGKDLGLLPTDAFSMLVIMALVSTFIATPLIRWLMKGQESLATHAGRAGRRCAASATRHNPAQAVRPFGIDRREPVIIELYLSQTRYLRSLFFRARRARRYRDDLLIFRTLRETVSEPEGHDGAEAAQAALTATARAPVGEHLRQFEQDVGRPWPPWSTMPTSTTLPVNTGGRGRLRCERSTEVTSSLHWPTICRPRPW